MLSFKKTPLDTFFGKWKMLFLQIKTFSILFTLGGFHLLSVLIN